MPKQALLLVLLVVMFAFGMGAQTKVPCYSGDKNPSCTPAEQLAKAKLLAKAKTAAVIIEATQGIACGDGSDGCFRTDDAAISIVQRAVGESELWQDLTMVEPPKADVLLKFSTKDGRSLGLCAYDADSNDLLWCENRYPSIALDNDSSREIAHFLKARRAAAALPPEFPRVKRKN
jgi:hypothetical protein